MKIAVCMKQVPAISEGQMDEKTGVIIRSGLQAITNVYDLSALEAALRIQEKISAQIDVFTMGPESSEAVIREAYSMGAEKGYLLCDSAFAGADVLATSYTLMQAIQKKGPYDLILCGRQTTDGDTAQVSGALAKWLEIPHRNWVTDITEISEKGLVIEYLTENFIASSQIYFPCLLSIERMYFIPRMPSLKLKINAKKKLVNKITLDQMQDINREHYGLKGSATKVEKIFPPEQTKKHPILSIGAEEAADYIIKILEG